MSTKALITACLFILSSLIVGIPARADPVVSGEEHCVINVAAGDALNLRSAPSAGSTKVTQLRYGTCGIQVTGPCEGNWCPVEDGHFKGWAHRHYLAMVSPAIYCVTGIGLGDVLNLRAFPSAQSKVLVELGPHQCEIAFLPYATATWQKVRASGWEGWVNRKFLSGQ